MEDIKRCCELLKGAEKKGLINEIEMKRGGRMHLSSVVCEIKHIVLFDVNLYDNLLSLLIDHITTEVIWYSHLKSLKFQDDLDMSFSIDHMEELCKIFLSSRLIEKSEIDKSSPRVHYLLDCLTALYNLNRLEVDSF